MEGGGSGVAAARVGRASGAGFSVYGGPVSEPRLPGVRLLVCLAAFPKPTPRGLPTARQTHAHFHLLLAPLARFFLSLWWLAI